MFVRIFIIIPPVPIPTIIATIQRSGMLPRSRLAMNMVTRCQKLGRDWNPRMRRCHKGTCKGNGKKRGERIVHEVRRMRRCQKSASKTYGRTVYTHYRLELQLSRKRYKPLWYLSVKLACGTCLWFNSVPLYLCTSGNDCRIWRSTRERSKPSSFTYESLWEMMINATPPFLRAISVFRT